LNSSGRVPLGSRRVPSKSDINKKSFRLTKSNLLFLLTPLIFNEID